MSSVLSVNNLSKNFGKIQAVNNLNLNIQAGEVFGILGPNGSGKTTTLGMLLDVVAPSEGSFSWFEGQDNVEARKRIGAILETPCFYPYLTAVENLRITAHIKECPTSRIDEVLQQIGLYERRNDNFKGFSLGMKQRLSIGAALLADPPVLILDEPTNGLDPQGIAEIRGLIKDIASNGKTIIMASHLLDEVQKVCTHFCVLRNGVKLHQGAVKDILGETNEIEVASENEKLEEVLQEIAGIEKIVQQEGSFFLTLKEKTTADTINRACFEQGVTLKKLVTQSKSLEQEFLKILKEK
ncbi:MAG: ABC transporter ATP-binding protein [Cyclobacteriaceae bacterium]